MIRRLAVASALLSLVACTSITLDRPSPEPSGSNPAGLRMPSVAPGGAPTLQRAIRDLCVPLSPPGGKPASGELSPEVADIVRSVEAARGHTFEEPPVALAVTDAEMDRRLEDNFDAYYPEDLYDRRTFAWRTLGVIGPDDDLHEAYRAFLTGEVVGFYDPETGELVYRAGGDLGLFERLALAHELTHALDDQLFDLTRLDRLTSACQDERAEAALGVVEGSAQYFSALAVAEAPDVGLQDLLDLLAQGFEGAEPPKGVPPFLQALSTWPYVGGLSFVSSIATTGGTEAVDGALERFPTSTEQVIHPDRYPADRPGAVQIPDLTGALGRGWGDLDAMTIGEEWLREMLALRLDGATADDAGAGWDGGAYRAFSDGTDVAAVLRTRWDTAADASAFAEALQSWGSSVEPRPAIDASGTTVTAVFATTPAFRTTAAQALADG